MTVTLMLGDCLERMKEIEAGSVDAVVTDPPYGLSFMGKRWDYDVPSVEIWAECLRVLKPGGHLLAFAGTRTQHRMAVRIEDAGFEIRDLLAWVYGSGFPKSLDVSKAIDKAAGAERGTQYRAHGDNKIFGEGKGKAAGVDRTPGAVLSDPPATPAARAWQGWGTALKPALEPITVARKPLIGTVAENVLAHGTGAVNIDACRVPSSTAQRLEDGDGTGSITTETKNSPHDANKPELTASAARWPANFIHDGSDEVVGLLKEAARFFYCAKASKADRGDGNGHPTVKPTDLMRYLCRLITPPGGVVLDPFTGSGSTGKAAKLEGFRFIGIERDPTYFDIAKRRIDNTQADMRLAT